MRHLAPRLTIPVFLGAFSLGAAVVVSEANIAPFTPNLVEIRRPAILGVEDQAATLPPMSDTTYGPEPAAESEFNSLAPTQASQIAYLQLQRRNQKGEWQVAETIDANDELGLRVNLHGGEGGLVLSVMWADDQGRQVSQEAKVPLRDGLIRLSHPQETGQYLLQLALNGESLASYPVVIMKAK